MEPLSEEEKVKALKEIESIELYSIGGNEPHESWGGWFNFIKKGLDLRGVNENVFWFGSTNCDYTVMRFEPYRGMIIESFGYVSGIAFKKNKWKELINELLGDQAEIKALHDMAKEKKDISVLGFAKMNLKENAFGGRWTNISNALDRI